MCHCDLRHASWTDPSFHGLRRGQRSGPFQTRPSTYFACSFGRQHLPGFPSLPSCRPETQGNLKTTSNPWSQESSFFLRGSYTVSTDFRRGQGLLFFSAERTHLIGFFGEALPLWLSVPGLCRPRCDSLAPGTMSTKSSIVFLPHVFQSHRSPRVSSDHLHKDHHTCPHAFSVIVHRLEACGNISFFSRDSAIFVAEPLLIPNFQPEVCRAFVLEAHLDSSLRSQGRTFFFFHQISLPVIS